MLAHAGVLFRQPCSSPPSGQISICFSESFFPPVSTYNPRLPMNLPILPACARSLVFLLAPLRAEADVYLCQQDNVAKLVQKKIPGSTCTLVHKDAKRKKPQDRIQDRTASSNPNNFPSVSAQEQAYRDSLRRPILEQELRQEIRLSKRMQQENRKAAAASNLKTPAVITKCTCATC